MKNLRFDENGGFYLDVPRESEAKMATADTFRVISYGNLLF